MLKSVIDAKIIMMNQKGEKELKLGAQGKNWEWESEFFKLKTLKNLKEEVEVARIGEEIENPRAAIPSK